MRVILSAFGTTGDNAPIIALAEALRAQGDEPLLILNPLYEAAAAARALPFVAAGARWDPADVADAPKYADPMRGAIAIWNDFYLPRVEPYFRAVKQAIADRGADLVVSHWLCFGSHFAARQSGVRNAVVSLAPCWWYSRRDPSLYGPFDAPDWVLRSMVFLPRLLVNRFINRSLRGICDKLALPWRRDEYFAVQREAHLNLGLWSPTWRPPAEDDPSRATICGTPWDTWQRATLAPELERFLDEGPPPLVVGLGSSATMLGHDLYREIAAAAEALGIRAVLVGAQPQAASGHPAVRTVPAAPYPLLFPRARAIIHHGGIGTMAEAMRAGKPTAIVPFANDQYDNARRARRLGGVLRWSRRQTRGPRLRRELRRLLEDQALAQAAADLGARIRGEENGAIVAARLLTGR